MTPTARPAGVEMNGDSPLVSLILVTYNSADLLPAFFAALERTAYAPYEVLVVDNASTDGTVRYLAAAQPELPLLVNRENVGFGRACNQGARAAAGELIVFLNPDVAVTPDWLTILQRHLDERPDAGIICPSTLYPDQSPPQATVSVEEVASVPGCAMMVTRRAWEQLGGFDEHIFMYWEDTELCWRAWLLGWPVLTDLEAYVYHERGGSTRGQRWDHELIKNSLFTYLKLMRWRRVLPFAAGLAARTAIKLVLHRDPRLLAAWTWNLRRLRATLHERRAIPGRPDRAAHLERLVDMHQAGQRRARRDRRVRTAA